MRLFASPHRRGLAANQLLMHGAKKGQMCASGGQVQKLDTRTSLPYGIVIMIIRSIKHRGLRRLIEDDDARELRADLVGRIRNILAALLTVQDMSGVAGPPGWRVHQLAGDRAGTWSISASGNWRITFDIVDTEIAALTLEDYH